MRASRIALGIAAVGILAGSVGTTWWIFRASESCVGENGPQALENRAAGTVSQSGHFEGTLFERAERLNARIMEKSDAAKDLAEADALIRAWAAADPESAARFALSPMSAENRGGLFLQFADDILVTWAKRDLHAAKAFLAVHAADTQAARLVAPAFMKTYVGLDAPGAMQWLENGFESDSGVLRPLLARELVKALQECGNITAAREWLSKPEVSTRAYAHPAVEELGRRIAASGAEEDASFVKQLPRGTMSRGLAMQEAMRQRACKDVRWASEWLIRITQESKAYDRTLPDEKPEIIPDSVMDPSDADYAVAGFVLGTFMESSEAAYDNLERVRDPSLRARTRVALLEMVAIQPAEDGQR